jgi:hypothetical protein
MTGDGEDPLVKMFELTAQLREQSVDSVEVAEESLKWTSSQLRALAENPELTDEALAKLDQLATELTETVEARLKGLAKQARGYVEMLGTINLDRPEHVGVMLAQAESLRSVAAMTVALAADIRLVQEIRRRVTGG